MLLTLMVVTSNKIQTTNDAGTGNPAEQPARGAKQQPATETSRAGRDLRAAIVVAFHRLSPHRVPVRSARWVVRPSPPVVVTGRCGAEVAGSGHLIPVIR